MGFTQSHTQTAGYNDTLCFVKSKLQNLNLQSDSGWSYRYKQQQTAATEQHYSLCMLH